MIDGVGDRCRGADNPDLADPLRAHRVQVLVRVVDPEGVDVKYVRARRHVVLGEVVVEVVAELHVHHALLEERHRQPPGHAPDELRASRYRIEDPAGGERAEHPGDTHLTGVDVHPDLGKLGPEGVAGEVIPLSVDVRCAVCLHLDRGPGRRELGRVLDLLSRVGLHRYGRLLAGRETLAQLPAGEDNGRSPRGRPARASGQRSEWQRAVADLHVHLLEPDLELIGGDLSEDCARPGADVRGTDLNGEASVLLGAGDPARWPSERGEGRGGHPRADQPSPVAANARLRVPRLPAEPLGALAQAGDEVPRAPGVPRLRIPLARLVHDSQLDGIDSAGDRELVDRRLEPVHPRGLARRPHPGGRGHVEGGQVVRGAHASGRVHVAGADGGLLGELPDRRGLLEHVVDNRGHGAVLSGSDPQPLDRGGAIAGEDEHLLPGHGQLHRPPESLCRQRGCDCVRARSALRAKAAPDVLGDHPYLIFVEPEQAREHYPPARRALGRVIDGQRAVVPEGNARVRLHRVVVLGRRAVDLIDDDFGLKQRAVRIAAVGAAGVGRVDNLGLA